MRVPERGSYHRWQPSLRCNPESRHDFVIVSLARGVPLHNVRICVPGGSPYVFDRLRKCCDGSHRMVVGSNRASLGSGLLWRTRSCRAIDYMKNMYTTSKNNGNMYMTMFPG